MRRMLVPGALLLLLAGIYLIARREPAHISSLVPPDFTFGYFTSSLNDLRQLYEAPYARKDADPAHLRFGRPCNVPGLDGVDHDQPAGNFWTADGKQIYLMPVLDPGAFEDAFERERESIRMREPEAVAKNYRSLSDERIAAQRGPRNDLVLDAVKYPLALCGHPRDGVMLRMMLWLLLAPEPAQKPSGLPVLAKEAARLPAAVADPIARECEDLLLGFPLPESPEAPLRLVGEATLAPTGMVARSAHLVTQLDLTDIARSFPFNTVVLLGLVLDARGWQEVGMPLPLGDAAFACGLLEEKIHARRFTVLMAARPRSPHDLARLTDNGLVPLVGDRALVFAETEDQGALVRTAPLPEPPAWLAQVLRSDADAPPPVYLATAVERGIWYCAIGSQAEAAVRRALYCLRDRPELGISRAAPVAAHPEFLAGPHVGLGLLTANGLKAFQHEMPFFEIASLGQPPWITAVLDVDDRAQLECRIAR